VVILIGPPGAGKNTQARILGKELGIPVVSADDLIAANKSMFQRYKNPTIQGVDPQQDAALNTLVEEALRKLDLSKGVILDGYPASKTQADFLVGLREKNQLPKAVVIRLQVPDDVLRKRLPTSDPVQLQQDIKNYHREFDFAQLYFPATELHDVDGNRKIDQVTQEIRKVIEAR
jgi:adenylate kinase